MALPIVSPSESLQRAVETRRNNDWLATFSRELSMDATVNITIPQAMQMFMKLSKSYKDRGGSFAELGAAIQMAAVPMVSPVNKLPGDAREQNELLSFFALSPEDAQSTCSTPAVDLPPQTKNLFREKETVDNYLTEYWTMLLAIRRHGPGLSLIDCYYAVCSSSETSIWQWANSVTDKRQKLKSLKVRTQAYLAQELCNRHPVLQLVRQDSPEDREALGA